MTPDHEDRYVPALRFHRLTRFFDPLLSATMREARLRERILGQAGLVDGHRVLDLGCGTGTLAILVNARHPGVEVVGLDPDAQALGIARRKAERAGVEVRWDKALGSATTYPADHFDRVLSTLVLHHLGPAAKRTTLAEVARVLVPGGELHVADFGKPSDPLMALAVLGPRLLDGRANTADNVAGRLPGMFEAAGLGDVAETGRLRTVFGSVSFYRAVKAGASLATDP